MLVIRTFLLCRNRTFLFALTPEGSTGGFSLDRFSGPTYNNLHKAKPFISFVS
jgi:hypothetical protein